MANTRSASAFSKLTIHLHLMETNRIRKLRSNKVSICLIIDRCDVWCVLITCVVSRSKFKQVCPEFYNQNTREIKQQQVA